MRAEQMASPVLLTPVSVEQLKVWGCFSPASPPPSPKSTDCKHDKRSNICEGKRSGTTVHQRAAPASAGARADECSPEPGPVITPHRSE